MRPLPLLYFTALFVTGGCDDKITTGTGSLAETRSACAQGCAWESDCNLADFDLCVDQCVEDAAGWERQDALAAENACIARLSCDEDPDDCGAYVEPLPEHLAFAQKCTAAIAACGAEDDVDCSVTFDPDDPDAGLVRYMTPAVVAQLSACLDAADCTDVVDCIDDVYDAYGL
ncbi:MAG: hypothetical protein KF773_29005 [Deltaproteobacteria bacterium]|nr:hypothetical protein [Deltaproteobacteria bacterium]